MQGLGTQPCHSYFVCRCRGQAGLGDRILPLLEAMQGRGLAPDGMTLAHAVGALVQCQQLDAAVSDAASGARIPV
jgi:hypothetical protein